MAGSVEHPIHPCAGYSDIEVGGESEVIVVQRQVTKKWIPIILIDLDARNILYSREIVHPVKRAVSRGVDRIVAIEKAVYVDPHITVHLMNIEQGEAKIVDRDSEIQIQRSRATRITRIGERRVISAEDRIGNRATRSIVALRPNVVALRPSLPSRKTRA